MKDTKRKLSWTAVIVLIVSMMCSAAFIAAGMSNNLKESREKELRSTAQIVNGEIVNAFIKPITVAKAMAEDVSLVNLLKEAGNDPKGSEDDMKEYLSSLRDGLGYKMMFAVSDETGAYFTCDGITSFIDKDYKDNSAWYGNFMSSGKEMDLDVDIEESADWALSVFVNQLVVDDNKNVLGVCGTGVEMTQLQSLIELYERIYQVKIDVTDETGLIQIATDESKIENEHVNISNLENYSDGEYYYESSSEGDRVISYMDEIDMYLVVTNTKSEASNFISDIKIPAALMGAGTVIAIILMLVAERLYKKEPPKAE